MVLLHNPKKPIKIQAIPNKIQKIGPIHLQSIKKVQAQLDEMIY